VPIPCVALKPVSCGTTVWRRGGVLQVTVVVKATFGMMHDANARLIAPLPIVPEERHHAGGGSVAEPSDLAPYLPSGGVILWGSAHAPRPAPAMTIRLAVYRERPLVDKMLHVFGDRPPGARDPQPFQQIPIVYERAYGGPGVPDNPVGTGAAADGRAPPNFVDPADPRRPAGFGPLSSRWGARRRLLGSRGEPTAEIPDGFDFRWFHAAPVDQQCDFFHGDEWIVLDGMHPTLPRLQTHLPGVHAEAVWVASLNGRPPEGRMLQLHADTLLVDAERHLCSLVWRGHFALEQADALPTVRIFAGVAMPGYPMSWPDEAHLGPHRAPEPDRAPPVPVLTEPDPDHAPTEKIVISRVKAPALPFSKAAPGDVAARFKEVPELNSTVATVSPFAGGSALPFAKGSAPPAVASPGAAAAPGRGSLGDTETSVTSPFAVLPFGPAAGEAPPAAPAKSAWADEDSSTRMIDPAQIAAGAQSSWSAPFAIAAPAAREPAAAPLPGAPWSGVAAAEVEKGDPSASTVAVRASDVLRALGRAADPPAPPPPVAAPPAVVAPPMVAPPPMMPPAMVAPPAAVPPPIVPPPIAPPPMASSPVAAFTAPPPVASFTAPSPPPPPPLVEAETRATPPPPPSLGPVEPPAAAPKAARAPRNALQEKLLAALDAGEPLDAIDLAGGDLADIDLRGRSLAGCRMKGALLKRADLTGSKLAGAVLADADLAEAKLDGADLAGADLTNASLAGASFRGATLTEARLDGARGEGAIFDEATLGKLSAPGVELPRASFKKAAAEGSTWERATLDGAVFQGAKLRGANFQRASCNKADFSGADLAEAQLARLTAEGADLYGANLEGATLKKAELAGATLTDANLRKASAEKADLSRAELSRAKLEGASARAVVLKGAILARALLDGADLRDADLEGANVFGASRQSTKLNGANTKDMVEVDPERPGA
jgi:uncharacterized protein YjbI with pentapeptide repeats